MGPGLPPLALEAEAAEERRALLVAGFCHFPLSLRSFDDRVTDLERALCGSARLIGKLALHLRNGQFAEPLRDALTGLPAPTKEKRG
jgi:hypothetical protein